MYPEFEDRSHTIDIYEKVKKHNKKEKIIKGEAKLLQTKI